MDNYIYFRVLDYLAKCKTSTRSDLILVAGLGWKNNPIAFLVNCEVIQETQGELKDAIYFELTDKGKILYNKMKLFYDTYSDMLAMLSIRKFKVRGFNKNVVI
jgi:predicted transcriptional regulator